MSQTFTMDELVARGEQVYSTWGCGSCHGASGGGGIGPSLVGSSITTGPINDHLSLMVNGVQGTIASYPEAKFPTFNGLKPSTSFLGSIVFIIFFWLICFGNGS